MKAPANRTTVPRLTPACRKRLREQPTIIALVRKVCVLAGDRQMLRRARKGLRESGVVNAIRRHDDAAIFEWLHTAISFQGVADRAAEAFIEEHGHADYRVVTKALSWRRLCPKLRSFGDFKGCGFRKTEWRCNEPNRIDRCPLPRLDLRNGLLNQAAFALALFMRDVANNDFVGWLDNQLEAADQTTRSLRGPLLAASIVLPLRAVHGLSDKVLNMGLADLLLAGDRRRRRWVAAGAAMIAIDRLVHNWLHRTGILRRLKAAHRYGRGCYADDGCAAIINAIAARIDSRAFNKAYPRAFPRFVQHAIWRFCAQSGLARCNGNTVRNGTRCRHDDCPLFQSCDRVVLHVTATGKPGRPPKA